MTIEAVFFTFFGLAFITMGISWVLFGRISMARIEKELKRDGIDRLASWDGVGARALWYCHAIVIPLGKWNLPNDPFFDVMTARKYAKPIDKKLGLVLMISGYSGVLIVLFGAFVLDLY